MLSTSGQVAQVVERSPEKAGVGGSTPSLATIVFSSLAIPVTFTSLWVATHHNEVLAFDSLQNLLARPITVEREAQPDQAKSGSD